MLHQPYQDTENRIIGNLLRSPLESKSMHAIAKATGLTYVTVYKVIPTLEKKHIVRVGKKGKAHLVAIDFERADGSTLSDAIGYERGLFLRKHPQITVLRREIEEGLIVLFYSLVLFGSYARGNARADSDIDLLFIIPPDSDKELYRKKVDTVLRLHPAIKKDYSIVTSDDFMDMLGQKYTVGREAFLNGLVLFGAEQYYAMVKHYARTKGY
jgi:predicted nucleotidyltransferase